MSSDALEETDNAPTGWIDAAGVHHDESEPLPYEAWEEVLELIGMAVLDVAPRSRVSWPSRKLRALFAKMPKLLTVVPGMPDPNVLLSEPEDEPCVEGKWHQTLHGFVTHYGRDVGLLAAVIGVAFQFGNLHGRSSSAAELQRLRSEIEGLRHTAAIQGAVLRLFSAARKDKA